MASRCHPHLDGATLITLQGAMLGRSDSAAEILEKLDRILFIKRGIGI